MVAENLMAADMQPLPPVALPPIVSAPPETQAPLGTTIPSALPPTVTQGPGLSTPGPLFPTSSAPASRPLIPEPPSVLASPRLSTAPSLQPPPLVLPPEPAPSSPAVQPSAPAPSSIPAPVASSPIPASAAPYTPIARQPVAAIEAPLLVPTEPPPTTGVPQVSQPLHGVSPETTTETAKKVEEEGIYFNVADEDIREVVKQISRALGKNFLLDDKLKGKITIISERKMTKDEVWEAFQSALDVIGYTIVQGPAGLLRIVAVREALSNPIDLYTDKTPFTDRFITRLITLKNISAADMANVIKGLVSKEGNLFAYPVTNTLIVTDSGTNIDRLIRLINELDREGPQEVLEIIPILYANAKDLAGKITQIFETEKSGSTAAPIARGGAAKGAEAANLEEAPRLKKVIPDDRTNSLIILASKIAIRKVRDLIKKLDSPLVGDEGEVHVYYLKYATAKDMATVLNAISGAVQQSKSKTGAATSAPPGTTAAPTTSSLLGGAEFSGKFTVTAEESTNSLVITAGAKDYNTLVDQVIAKLDIPRRQVYVEAVIVELSITESQQLGSGILGGKAFKIGGQTLSAFGSTFGFLDLNRLLAGTVGAGSDQTINVNLPGSPGASSGGTSATSVPAFFAAIQFAQNNTDVNILSTPNILTLDNQEAEIKVGQKIYQPAAQATTIGGSLQTSFTGEDVALSLKVKPQITEGGSIRMEVTQEDREALPPQQIGSGVSPIPTTLRSIKTAIVAQDGQTIVLGGLIKDKYTTTVDKIPGLGDIPILGYLFKTRKKEKQKVNLMVFMTPHVIREPRDFLAILQRKINEQNEFVTDNFGKGQQKQIRKSLETHADYLLKIAEGKGPISAYTTPQTEEDKYPMDLVPPVTPPMQDAEPAVESKPKSKSNKKSETVPPEAEMAPPPSATSAPEAVSEGVGEDSDLALEGRSSGGRGKRSKKAKATAPEQQSPTESAPPSTGKSPSKPDDIDLAY